MREGKYAKILAKSAPCNFSYERYVKKLFAQIKRASYEGAMLVSIQMGTKTATVLLRKLESSSKEYMNIKIP